MFQDQSRVKNVCVEFEDGSFVDFTGIDGFKVEKVFNELEEVRMLLSVVATDSLFRPE